MLQESEYAATRRALIEANMRFVSVIHHGDEWFEFWSDTAHSSMAVLWPDGLYAAFEIPKGGK